MYFYVKYFKLFLVGYLTFIDIGNIFVFVFKNIIHQLNLKKWKNHKQFKT